MEKGRIFKFVGFILLLCLAGTAVAIVIGRLTFGTVTNSPTTIDIRVNAPSQVTRNEPFAVTLRFTNLVPNSQTLHSIDLDTNYLENVRLASTVPNYKEVRTLPFTHFTSYNFEETLPATQITVVELTFLPEQVGQFSGLMDVCLEDGTLCQALPLAVEVVE